MAFFNRFPYTNFHELNLDWILERIKEIAGETLVKMVNGISADSSGNISLSGADIPGIIRTVNNQSGDSDGNVNVGTVKMVNNILPSSTGNVNVGTVRYVCGISPSSNGNVPLGVDDIPGAIKTVNNTYPTNGNVDVGTVKSVNNSLPDLNGNVNLPSVSGVTSVNGVGADAQGNIQLAPYDIGAVSTNNVKYNIYKSLSDIGLTPGNVSMSDAYSTLPINSILICASSEFESASKPVSGSGTIVIVKNINNGYITFIGNSKELGVYKQYANNNTPDGVWLLDIGEAVVLLDNNTGITNGTLAQSIANFKRLKIYTGTADRGIMSSVEVYNNNDANVIVCPAHPVAGTNAIYFNVLQVIINGTALTTNHNNNVTVQASGTFVQTSAGGMAVFRIEGYYN